MLICFQLEVSLEPAIESKLDGSRFIQNGMKPNPDKHQAMVLGKTEELELEIS